TLCRDHAGIKPLFFYHDLHNVVFSSELKAIRSIKKDLQINTAVIPYFLHIGFIPQPFTIYQNVEKFPSAHYMQINVTGNILDQFIPKPYWNKLIQDVPR